MILIFAKKGTKERYACSISDKQNEEQIVRLRLRWLNKNSKDWVFIRSVSGGILYESKEDYLG